MAKLSIDERVQLGTIEPEIYGQFSEHLGRGIYGGIFVGEDSDIPNTNGMRNDVVSALKEMGVPVLRWPGGCFADEYHWMDGIGPKENRKRMVNTNWGGVTEDNSFGTHEFFELCRQLGCKTYINGNVGSGTVREMSEWVEYMTFDGESPMANLRAENGHPEPFKVDYFGIGNENWGCGGNMTPAYYGDLYRHYQSFVKNYDEKTPIKKICCGPNEDDVNWTREVLAKTFDHGVNNTHGFMDGLSLHCYDVPGTWEHKGAATEFAEDDWYRTLRKAERIEKIIDMHQEILDEFDKQKLIGMIVDEWGCWFDVEPGTNPGFLFQQNTMRDAMVAAVTLNIFNKHCDRVKMANIAQMVNVLQSMVLTEGDKMLLTPTYHVFKMFKAHQGAKLLQSQLSETTNVGSGEDKIENLQQSVSITEDGSILVTIAHMDVNNSTTVDINFADFKPVSVEGSILNAEMNDYNTYTNKDCVTAVEYRNYTLTEDGVSCSIPPCSVVALHIKG